MQVTITFAKFFFEILFMLMTVLDSRRTSTRAQLRSVGRASTSVLPRPAGGESAAAWLRAADFSAKTKEAIRQFKVHRSFEARPVHTGRKLRAPTRFLAEVMREHAQLADVEAHSIATQGCESTSLQKSGGSAAFLSWLRNFSPRKPSLRKFSLRKSCSVPQLTHVVSSAEM